MRPAKTGFLLVLLLAACAAIAAQAVVAPATAAPAAGEGRIYFEGLFEGFETETEIASAKAVLPLSDATAIKEALYYFMDGSSLPRGDKRKAPVLEKSIEIFERLWKKNRSDPKTMILLAYAYTAYCDATDNLETILSNVFKARNLFTLVVQKLPENIDARLGRIRININLTPMNGRPDDMLLADALAYVAAYDKTLSEAQRRDDYFRSGYAESCLGAAVVYDERRDKVNAQAYFRKIELSLVPPHLSKLYKILQKKYGA